MKYKISVSCLRNGASSHNEMKAALAAAAFRIPIIAGLYSKRGKISPSLSARDWSVRFLISIIPLNLSITYLPRSIYSSTWAFPSAMMCKAIICDTMQDITALGYVDGGNLF